MTRPLILISALLALAGCKDRQPNDVGIRPGYAFKARDPRGLVAPSGCRQDDAFTITCPGKVTQWYE